MWIENKIQYKGIIYLSLLGIFSVIFCLFLTFAFPSLFEDIDNKTFDYRMKIRGPIPIHPEIVYIDIDDRSIKEIGRWPWDRSIHAKLIDLLSYHNVACIGFNVVFHSKFNEIDDHLLAKSTLRAGNIIYPVGFELLPERKNSLDIGKNYGEKNDILKNSCIGSSSLSQGELYHTGRIFSPIIEIMDAAVGLGHISATPDRDGVFRRIPLVIDLRGQTFPSFDLQILLHYWKSDKKNIRIHLGEKMMIKGLPPVKPNKGKYLSIPIDKKGQMIINFAGRWGECFRHYSYVDVLRGEGQILNQLENKICLVAVTATGFCDTGASPLDNIFPLSGIHANILNTILTRNFVREIPYTLDIITLLLLGLMIAFLSQVFRPLIFTLTSFLSAAIYMILAFIVFKEFGVLLKFLSPILVIGLSFLSTSGFKYMMKSREKRQLELALQRYVSPQILKQVLEDPNSLSLRGKRKELTIFFSDVRGFTKFTQSREPEEVIQFLNEYHSEMGKLIFAYEGTIQRFEGDGMMVFFGDPLSQEDHLERAIRMALAMRERIHQLKRKWERADYPSDVGMGIETGYVTVGNIGFEGRMEYTAVGNAVNMASRLCDEARGDQILIRKHTLAKLKDSLTVEDLGNKELKGVLNPVRLYNVLGLKESGR